MPIPNNDTKAIVTIAIPFYNAEKYLREAIESVFGQTYTDWRLLLIDDGSTDTSLEIARYFEKKDKRVEVLSDGKNANLGYRLNQAPALVSTPFLARMDADDIMHPRKIEKQMHILLNTPMIDVLGTNAYSINEKDEVVGIRIKPASAEIVPCKGFIHPTIIGKTQWFRDNPYNVGAVRVEDIELWMRSVDKSNFMMISEPLFFYREFGGGYYKKYAKSLSPLWDMAKQNNFKVAYIKLFVKTCLSTIVYFVFDQLGFENQLISRRNAISLPVKNYKEYVE